MEYKKIIIPEEGEKIKCCMEIFKCRTIPLFLLLRETVQDLISGKLPKFVFDNAVEKAYQGKRKIVWMEIYAGEKANSIYGTYLPDETVEAVKDFIVAIKGPLTTPVGGGIRSLNVALRQILDLYACIRPVKYYEGTPSPVKKPESVDMIIFRENTEDVYSGIEWAKDSNEAQKIIEFINNNFQKKIRSDSGIGIKPISEFGSKRIARKALKYSLENNRKCVTIVHKGNIMKYTEGAFKNWAYEVAVSEFRDRIILESEITEKNKAHGRMIVKDRIADNMFQQVLLKPDDYDVIVTTNLNGDYLSDAIAAQVGGLGMAPGSNIGDFYAVFEATHGTAPKYAGLDKVNPGSLILSGVMMLEYLGWKEAGSLIKNALEKTIKNKIVTYDLARQIEGAKLVKTSEFAKEICGNI